MDFIHVDVSHASIMAQMDRLCFKDGCFEESLFTALLMQNECVGLMVMKDEQPAGQILFRYLTPEAEILTLSVLPKFRGLGFARGLVTQAFSTLRNKGVEDVYLEVRKSNEAALALYRSVGGEIVGERPEYYENVDGSREDAFVIQISLN